MNLHIVLNVNVVLDLLLKRPPAANEKARLFSEFNKSGAIFYIAVCALPSLVNTEYPSPFEDVNLRAMQTIGHAFGVAIGYSDHR
jgi:sialic acid synthase SpsE